MKKVLAVVAIVVLTCSVAGAAARPGVVGAESRKIAADHPRTNGTLGSFSGVITQVGALTVEVDISCTTAGGDGVPFTGITTGGGTITLNDQVWIYGQIYDSPWVDGCTSWTTPGVNFCAVQEQYFINSPAALHSFHNSFTAVVPHPDDYQAFGLFLAGLSWPTPAYQWGDITQGASGGNYTLVMGPTGTTYIDSSVPPTATPDPTAGGIPVPTMNQWGIAAMVILLIGVAMLIITRRQ